MQGKHCPAVHHLKLLLHSDARDQVCFDCFIVAPNVMKPTEYFTHKEMDVSEPSIKVELDCKKPRLIHTSESPTATQNGHTSTINLSYQVSCDISLKSFDKFNMCLEPGLCLQIVLQDHNYGAPLPPHGHESTGHTQCKQEPMDSVHVSCPQYTPGSHHSQRGLKTLTPRSSHASPQSGRGPRNGVNSSLLAKRQRASSGNNSNGVAYSPHSVTPPGSAPSRRPVPHGGETPRGSLTTPPLIPKVPLASFPYAGDLNSRLYASATGEKMSATPGATNGFSGYLDQQSGGGGSLWYTHGNGSGRLRFQDGGDADDDDDSNASLDSRRMGADSDHEGEETETAPECEDEEDEHRLERDHPQQLQPTHLDESVTRCIW